MLINPETGRISFINERAREVFAELKAAREAFEFAEEEFVEAATLRLAAAEVRVGAVVRSERRAG